MCSKPKWGRNVESQQIVQIVCGVLALVCVVIIVMRRKSKKKQQDDEF
jgi:hypothetical protein